MKTTHSFMFALLLALILLWGKDVLAEGTPAGTQIKNKATMNYKDLAGNSYDEFHSNEVVTVVAQLAGVAITPLETNITGDSIWVDYPIVVTNTGNGTDAFDLSISSTQSWGQTLYQDIDLDGVLSQSEIDAGPITVTPALLADSSFYLIGRLFVPDNTPSNTQDVWQVTATSQFDDEVSATGQYNTTISTTVIVASKTQDNSNPAPGDTITYTISYENVGTATGSGAVATDPLDLNVTFINGSIVVPAGNTATYDPVSRTITWNIGTIAGLQTGELTFKVIVNDDVLAGTQISNLVQLSYTDEGGNLQVEISPGTTATVAAIHLGYPEISPVAQTKDVGTDVVYPITLYNLGNINETVNVSASSTQNLTWSYWVDVDNDGVPGSSGDILLDPNNVGPVSPESSLSILVVATVTPGLADGTIDVTTFTFTSNADPDATGSITATTTVKAPSMKMNKSVAVLGGGQPIPGATLVYTITYENQGTGGASSIVISDPSPAFTSYVLNSVKHNGDIKTDLADSDEVEVINEVVIINVGTVGPGGLGIIEFRVTID
ncbi:hypothetical protein ACFLS9_06170 [Bacteroidota bacterium]